MFFSKFLKGLSWKHLLNWHGIPQLYCAVSSTQPCQVTIQSICNHLRDCQKHSICLPFIINAVFPIIKRRNFASVQSVLSVTGPHMGNFFTDKHSGVTKQFRAQDFSFRYRRLQQFFEMRRQLVHTCLCNCHGASYSAKQLIYSNLCSELFLFFSYGQFFQFCLHISHLPKPQLLDGIKVLLQAASLLLILDNFCLPAQSQFLMQTQYMTNMTLFGIRPDACSILPCAVNPVVPVSSGLVIKPGTCLVHRVEYLCF